MTMKTNLKRCPFCGAKPMSKLTEDNVRLVVCPYCGGQIRFYGREEEAVVKLWNSRKGMQLDELDYIKSFAREADLSEEICRDQLRSLWTAYCLRHNLIADTLDYDMDLTNVMNAVKDSEPDTGDWGDDEEFEDFMCRYLV